MIYLLVRESSSKMLLGAKLRSHDGSGVVSYRAQISAKMGLTLLEPQSHMWGQTAQISSMLSPKRDCGSQDSLTFAPTILLSRNTDWLRIPHSNSKRYAYVYETPTRAGYLTTHSWACWRPLNLWVKISQKLGKQFYTLTLLGPQSRFGGKLLELWVVCPQNGTAVLKGLSEQVEVPNGFHRGCAEDKMSRRYIRRFNTDSMHWHVKSELFRSCVRCTIFCMSRHSKAVVIAVCIKQTQ